jgi:hypothetical protein
LALVEGGRFFAENVLAGGESLQAEFGVAVWMGGYINGVEVGGEQAFN